MSYLDARVRFEMNAVLHNFHLMATPLFVRNTGEEMFGAFFEFLDTVVARCRPRAIAAATDGAANITGRISSLATRIKQIWEPGLMRL